MINKFKWLWINFFGKKRRIITTSNLKEDEILFYGYKIYVPLKKKTLKIIKEVEQYVAGVKQNKRTRNYTPKFNI